METHEDTRNICTFSPFNKYLNSELCRRSSELRCGRLLHVVLDEPLDLVAGVFVLGEFHTAVFKFVFELWWAEQNDSSANRPER